MHYDKHDNNDDDDIINLAWVKDTREETQKFLCTLCPPPDSILHEVTDPAKLETAGPNVTRYQCFRCGWMVDDVDPAIRRQEQISSILGDEKSKQGPIFEPVASTLKELEHTKEEVTFDLESNEQQYLRAEGINIKKEEVRSSVSGRRTIKKY